jgi:uncharacterized RDD family membrane protein YckC
VSTTNPYAPPKSNVGDVTEYDADPADRLLRLVAAILDTIIFGVMVYAPFFVILAGAGQLDEPATEGNPTVLGIGVILMAVGGIAWIWLTILFVVRNGQSIAKKMVGIKVVRSDGSPASLGRIFWLRNVVNQLLGIIPFYGLIDVLFIFGDRRRCLHDMIADTIVVRA